MRLRSSEEILIKILQSIKKWVEKLNSFLNPNPVWPFWHFIPNWQLNYSFFNWINISCNLFWWNHLCHNMSSRERAKLIIQSLPFMFVVVQLDGVLKMWVFLVIFSTKYNSPSPFNSHPICKKIHTSILLCYDWNLQIKFHLKIHI